MNCGIIPLRRAATTSRLSRVFALIFLVNVCQFAVYLLPVDRCVLLWRGYTFSSSQRPKALYAGNEPVKGGGKTVLICYATKLEERRNTRP